MAPNPWSDVCKQITEHVFDLDDKHFRVVGSESIVETIQEYVLDVSPKLLKFMAKNMNRETILDLCKLNGSDLSKKFYKSMDNYSLLVLCVSHAQYPMELFEDTLVGEYAYSRLLSYSIEEQEKVTAIWKRMKAKYDAVASKE